MKPLLLLIVLFIIIISVIFLTRAVIPKVIDGEKITFKDFPKHLFFGFITIGIIHSPSISYRMLLQDLDKFHVSLRCVYTGSV